MTDHFDINYNQRQQSVNGLIIRILKRNNVVYLQHGKE